MLSIFRRKSVLSARRAFSKGETLHETYLSQPIGKFDVKRAGRGFEEILEVEVSKETRLESEQRIQSTLSQFVADEEPAPKHQAVQRTKIGFNVRDVLSKVQMPE